METQSEQSSLNAGWNLSISASKNRSTRAIQPKDSFSTRNCQGALPLRLLARSYVVVSLGLGDCGIPQYTRTHTSVSLPHHRVRTLCLSAAVHCNCILQVGDCRQHILWNVGHGQAPLESTTYAL
eukprot:4476942-Amphidinium_carterae.1